MINTIFILLDNLGKIVKFYVTYARGRFTVRTRDGRVNEHWVVDLRVFGRATTMPPCPERLFEAARDEALLDACIQTTVHRKRRRMVDLHGLMLG